MENKICPVCGKEKNIKNKFCSFSCRNINTNKNRNYKDKKYLENLSFAQKNRTKYIEKEIKCICGKNILIKSNSRGKFKDKYFCSRSCANKRIFNDEIKNKISTAINLYLKENGVCGAAKINTEKTIFDNCKNCNINLDRKNRKIYCSDKCKKEYRIKDLTELQKYKLNCKFKFNLNSFKNEFDFKLIEEYGWYKAKNHGDNLNGISRDHILSISDGFKQKIDPLIISHPANCRLIKQKENSKKHSKSLINIEELLIKIKTWENKYGAYF